MNLVCSSSQAQVHAWWSTLSCRGMCTSPLAGWVRCFVLNHAAKLLLFSHFCCLTKGQYATIHTSFVLHEGKVYFWGSNWAEFDKKHQKNAPIPKKWWLFWITFRKSSDFFGLCSEKVWLYLKKAVTLWAKIKMIKFACYYMPYNK